MKIKILFIKIILLLFVLTNNSFSKALPPGSGIGDVPANVLILLDKSGSMGARMMSGAGLYYPYASAADSSGNVYVGQYYTYGIKKFDYATKTVDTTFATGGTYRNDTTISRNYCRSYYPFSMKIHNDILYVASYYQSQIFSINLATGKCTWNKSMSYPRAISISQDHLFAHGSSNFYVRNLSTGAGTNCSYRGNLRNFLRYSMSMSVDSSASNLYMQRSWYIYRFSIGSNKCPSTNYASRWRVNNLGNYLYDIQMHDTDDSVMFVANYRNRRLHSITINGAKNGSSQNWQVGSNGRQASTAASIKFTTPYNVSLDTTNKRILVVDFYKNSVQFFDYSGTWLKEIGGSSGTRMSGAHEAIKAIVTDSSLTSGVDFGFAYWSSGSAGFSGWSGNITTGRARPCNSNNCLRVRAHKAGAARINSIINSVNPGGGTSAQNWARIGSQYYLNSMYSPIDTNLACQNSYLLVIGDGQWGGHNSARSTVISLLNSRKIKTFTVAYGGGIPASGLRNFRSMAQAGGTNDVIIANTTASLKTQLKSAISQIIAAKLSFTAPSITATIEEGGSLYQAQFDYEQNKEWQGTISRTKINADGSLDTTDSGNWSAADKVPAPASRKIWTVLANVDYALDYNNFVEGNATDIDALFELTNNEVADYHRDTDPGDGSTNTRRCANAAGVIDGTDDDIKGLINFVRGTDYFDYDADCNLTETRPNPLGDVYHSQLVVVGPPNAETAFVDSNQESYWRSINGYDAFASSNANRKEMIYAGANDGMLHAFDAKTGKEEWAFVPPLIAAELPNVVNTNLNRSGAGGTNAIFGVDGSPVVHDMYFKSPKNSSKAWHTILIIPYGRGGAGFSVLDITKPLKPIHLYSYYNDTILHTVHRVDHDGIFYEYDYIATSYSMSTMEESVKATDNYDADNNVSDTCNDSGTTSCYKSNTWTFPVSGLVTNDLRVIKDGSNYTNFNATVNSNGDTIIVFGDTITYSADPGDTNVSSEVGISIKSSSATTGVTTEPAYDYSQLGETWSSPRIFRLPNQGAGDSNVQDDIYVAVMGGGFGAQHSGVGSNLTIVDLENTLSPGKVHKIIDIEDLPDSKSDIVNSTPGTPVVVTADTARGINFRGALVYLNDFEGKITKFNLTNMVGNEKRDGSGNPIALYDNTTLFFAGSNSTNARYMYHPMDATIGQTTNQLWLYAGTGDYQRINDTTSGVQNLLLGIKDPDYPEYYDVAIPSKAADLTKCQNTTNDTTGARCPKTADVGWYITLDDYKKVTAEPTVYRGTTYFPIYKPTLSVNKCSLGDAYICGVDDECGTNISSRLGNLKGEECYYVGQGVLSKIVTFAGKLFANIAGQSTGAKKDLVSIDSGAGEVSIYRSSWRGNY